MRHFARRLCRARVYALAVFAWMVLVSIKPRWLMTGTAEAIGKTYELSFEVIAFVCAGWIVARECGSALKRLRHPAAAAAAQAGPCPSCESDPTPPPATYPTRETP